jgi:N-formylglutamate amidohydrolase
MQRLWIGALLFAGILPARAEDRALHIVVEKGELPFVISAPHGGKLDLSDTPPRTGEGLKAAPGGFVTSRDTGTEELAQEVAVEIRRRFDKPAHLVINRVHRKYCDPNRAPNEGYDSDGAKPHYEAYHAALKTACESTQRQFHRGLVIDLHGQGMSAKTVYRGTQNGKTVTLLRERFGEAAHTGPESLFGSLKAKNWTVHPDPHDEKEQAGFTGGYIVRTYGNPAAYGLDAIQLEFGNDYRTAAVRKETARVLVNALVEYGRRYLDQP